MLEMMRRSVSGWTAKFLLGLLVVSFAVWGIGDVFRAGSSNAVVTAGETTVSLQDYAFAYSQAESGIAQQLGRRLTAEEATLFGIDQSVLNRLTAGAVLDEQGRQIGLGLSDDRLAQRIAADPAFQDASGNFSRAAFDQRIASAGIQEQDFIRNQEQAAVRSQIIEALSEGLEVPAAFSTALGLYNGERRTVEYLTLAPSLVEPVAPPSDEVLQAYFEENQATYAAPEYRALDYVVLTPEAVADPSTITDEQVAADYNENPQRYRTEERRRVQQIIYPTQEAATAALARLESGATFEDIATESGRSVADTDLGLIARDQIPDAAIADAAFALEQGATSRIVDGTFGPAILRVTEIQPEAVQPLEEVSDQIRQELALEAAGTAAADAYNAFEDARAGGASLAEAAQAAGLTVRSIPAVDAEGLDAQGQPVPDLPAQEQLLTGAFETEPGFDNIPINFQSNGYIFYDVTSIEPARDRTLDEVRERVLADWTAQETQRLLTERVAALEASVEGGQSIDAIATELGLQKSTAQAITRESGVQEIGQAATSAAFSGGVGLVTTAPGTDGQSQLLLKVTEVSPPADPGANVPANQNEQMSAALQNDLLTSYVTRLQGSYPVRVYPDAIERAKAAVR